MNIEDIKVHFFETICFTPAFKYIISTSCEHLYLVLERKVSRGRLAPHMEGLQQSNANVAKYLSKVSLTHVSLGGFLKKVPFKRISHVF